MAKFVRIKGREGFTSPFWKKGYTFEGFVQNHETVIEHCEEGHDRKHIRSNVEQISNDGGKNAADA